MIERVERNDDLTKAEPVREVRQAKENIPGKPNKKFVAELERKISEEKGRKKQKKEEKDEIILRDENESPLEEDNKDDDNNMHQKNQTPPPSPDGQRGKKIDVLA